MGVINGPVFGQVPRERSASGDPNRCFFEFEAEERWTIHIGVLKLTQVWYPWTFELELSSDWSVSIGHFGRNYYSLSGISVLSLEILSLLLLSLISKDCSHKNHWHRDLHICITRCTKIPPFLAVVVQHLLNAFEIHKICIHSSDPNKKKTGIARSYFCFEEYGLEVSQNVY